MNKSIALLSEINTRVWLRDLSERCGRDIRLGNVPGEELDRIAALGLDAVWLMGTWLPSAYARSFALNDRRLRAGLKDLLPDLAETDIVSPAYAVSGHEVNPLVGTREDLLALKSRLNRRGIRLILDFVSNHLALDHPWLCMHPGYFLQGSSDDLRDFPDMFFPDIESGLVFAYGKDPFFPAWLDVAQLNYFNPRVHDAMFRVLEDIAPLCDGVRCDKAMLVVSSIQKSVWGNRVFGGGAFREPATEFWQRSIMGIRERYPDFIFIAEVYWGFESTFMNFGFDYVYDKPFYDALRDSDIKSIRFYLREQETMSSRRLRFIENHDEERAARVFGPGKSKAAAFIAAVSPGALLINQGQMEGCTVRLPPQLGRGVPEETDRGTLTYYRRLLHEVSEHRLRGNWTLIEPEPLTEDDATYRNFIVLLRNDIRGRYLAAINYSGLRSGCRIRLDRGTLGGRDAFAKDLLEGGKSDRYGDELSEEGIRLTTEPYGFKLFLLTAGVPAAAGNR